MKSKKTQVFVFFFFFSLFLLGSVEEKKAGFGLRAAEMFLVRRFALSL
jgi:hypothetical protein